MNRTNKLYLSAALVLSTAAPAFADWSFLGGPQGGMAGAGLAVPYNLIQSGRLNPAIYGLAKSDFQIRIPNFDVRVQGIGLSDLGSYLGGANSGGLSSDKLNKLAKNFGGNSVEFGASTGIGFYSGGLAIELNGSADVNTLPNAALQTYANSGGTGTVPLGARLDGYGVAGYEYSIAYGYRAPGPEDSGVAVGIRAKVVKDYYAHQFADANSINTNGSTTLAPEMNGNNSLSEDGFGIDLGAIYSSTSTKGLFFGATIENLIVPNTTFDASLPAGLAGVTTVRPYYRTFNIGSGYLLKDSFVFAADIGDVFNGGPGRELRAGLEYTANKAFQVRAGYRSGAGLTVGFGVYGINFAYSQSQPLQFTSAIKF